MQVFTRTADEIVPAELFGLWQLLLADLFVSFRHQPIFLFIGNESRNHSNRQNVVDQLKESLFLHMCIGEHKGLWLFEHESVKRFEIFSEI